MCTQYFICYQSCHCQHIGTINECEHGLNSPNCPGINNSFVTADNEKCDNCLRVYRGYTLWPLRGQLSVEQMNPEYFQQIQLRNTILNIPMGYFVDEHGNRMTSDDEKTAMGEGTSAGSKVKAAEVKAKEGEVKAKEVIEVKQQVTGQSASTGAYDNYDDPRHHGFVNPAPVAPQAPEHDEHMDAEADMDDDEVAGAGEAHGEDDEESESDGSEDNDRKSDDDFNADSSDKNSESDESDSDDDETPNNRRRTKKTSAKGNRKSARKSKTSTARRQSSASPNSDSSYVDTPPRKRQNTGKQPAKKASTSGHRGGNSHKK